MLLDGALATELERRGADLRDELWSAKLLIERPALIRAVHLDYFKAGADLATTASYQATFAGYARRGMDTAAAAQLMRDSVALAAAARDEFWADPASRRARSRPLIAASLGPYGAMLGDGSEYRGDYGVRRQILSDFHRPRIAAMAASGADLLAFETIPSGHEALLLAELLQDHPAAAAWVGFSCKDERHTSEGQDIGAAVAALNDFAQIVAVGVNCTAPEYVEGLLQRMRAATGKPLLAYPNSGERYDAVAKIWLPRPSASCFAAQAPSWFRAGARLIGGCCRTTPQDIGAIKTWSSALSAGTAAAD